MSDTALLAILGFVALMAAPFVIVYLLLLSRDRRFSRERDTWQNKVQNERTRRKTAEDVLADDTGFLILRIVAADFGSG